MNATQYLKTSFGILRIECSETAVLSISAETETAAEHPNELSRKTASELSEYFAGVRRQFDLPICPEGTELQKRVWEELRKIPYGETRSYGEIAEAVGSKRFSRAVGGANHRNPLPPRCRFRRLTRRLCRGSQAQSASAETRSRRIISTLFAARPHFALDY